MQVIRLSAGGYSFQSLHVSVYFQSCKRFYHLTDSLETNLKDRVASPH